MHMNPFCIGINCALGPSHMKPFLERLSDIAPYYCHAYANAGLPDGMGGFLDDKESFATASMTFVDEGFINMIGGCCGTTPEFIEEMWNRI